MKKIEEMTLTEYKDFASFYMESSDIQLPECTPFETVADLYCEHYGIRGRSLTDDEVNEILDKWSMTDPRFKRTKEEFLADCTIVPEGGVMDHLKALCKRRDERGY